MANKKSTVRAVPRRPVVGWREWVGLPGLGVEFIKVKVDTGARTSALHAFDVREYTRAGVDWVRFSVHPLQRSEGEEIEVKAKVLEYRSVRSSNGKSTVRPVIVTPLTLMGVTWDVELTLSSRDEMGFRMLLGREALRRRFVVDPARSFMSSTPKRSTPRLQR